jgi:hypothetical protein
MLKRSDFVKTKQDSTKSTAGKTEVACCGGAVHARAASFSVVTRSELNNQGSNVASGKDIALS